MTNGRRGVTIVALLLMVSNGLPVVSALAVCGVSYDAATGAIVGKGIAANTLVATGTPEQRLANPGGGTNGDLIVLTFPAGTVLSSTNIVAADFVIQQLAAGSGACTSSATGDGTPTAPALAPTITDSGGPAPTLKLAIATASLSSGSGPNSRFGTLKVLTSATAAGNEIVHPTTATTSATFSFAIQTSAGAPKDGPTTVSGITILADVPASVSAVQASFSGVTAGAQQALQALVRDQYGNPNAGVTVNWAVTAGGGSLSAPTSPTASDGIASITLTTGTTAGTNTATATVTSLPAVSFTVTTVAGSAAKLAFTTQPTNAATNAPITPAIQVSVLDANSNLVTGSTASITIAIADNPGVGSLSGTTTVAASAGVATFNGLSINQPGTGYTLRATGTSLTAATSATFNIVVAVSVSEPVLQDGTDDAGASWGIWTADPGEANVSSRNYLKVTNVGGNAPQPFTIDFSPTTFTGADGVSTIPLDGNIEFRCKEGAVGSTPLSVGLPSFTGAADDDGAISLSFTATDTVFYCQYRLLVVPNETKDQAYTAAYTVD